MSGSDGTLFVNLEIYNLKGQKVKSLSPSLCHPELVEGLGEMSVIWDGRDDNGQPVPSGIYFCNLVSDHVQESIKLLLLK